MFGLLMLLFLVVPVAELFVIVKVAGSIGTLETIGVLVAVSVVGAWLVKWQGLWVLGRVQAQLLRGVMPTQELVDAMLILGAGALMLTPGFLTDGVGLVLLAPPSRGVVRRLLMSRFRDGFTMSGAGPLTGFVRRFSDEDVTDVDSSEKDRRDDTPPDALP